jgi:signal transduction histidine kinase
LTGAFESWLKQEDFSYTLEGKDMIEYYTALGNTNFRLPESQLILSSESGLQQQYYHVSMFEAGGLFAFRETPFTNEASGLMKRFANVFNLTYKRFLDIQKAEAQAREAQIETALEKVRSRTMAMQRSEELPEAANNLFLQVQALGIPAWSAGYCIWDEDKKGITVWMSSEGVIQSSAHAPLTEDPSFIHMREAYERGESFHVEEVSGEALVTHYNYMRTLPAVGEILDSIIAAGHPLPTFQIFHCVYFSQGFLLFITYETVPEAHDIFKRFGNVFEQTYTRFLDLQLKEEQALRLREEKTKLEQTLGELQTTQKQLIQSEKMASLGELTAGIAHEIQNPLNFVNNFSEVSNELIEELKSEKAKVKSERDEQLENELLDDIAQNLQKINHHGKRADAIVKGMLQHSRSSAGTKEPTDINALADEYLRLSFHGLRAKDKSFNAKFETGFDPSVGKINVMPQDISRVILNLINNAFYAVDEKKKQNQNGYEPVVTVNTKKMGDIVEIKVRDNGNGIPQKVLDKIFQPFFTTKPTGQGTGLGLSLAYDIIKAHGGEIKVETKEGEGTAFIISLPVNQ